MVITMTPKVHIVEKDVINYVRLSTNRKYTCILPYQCKCTSAASAPFRCAKRARNSDGEKKFKLKRSSKTGKQYCCWNDE